MTDTKFIFADWPLKHLTALTTTRSGGVSKAPYDNFNLASYVKDNQLDVKINRQHLTEALKLEIGRASCRERV